MEENEMATRSAKIDQKADLIWAIADKLTGVYKPHEYGDVILPLTVIRRFDCILSDTKDAVLQKYEEVKNLPMKDVLLVRQQKKIFITPANIHLRGLWMILITLKRISEII